jgi:hypothetical protein
VFHRGTHYVMSRIANSINIVLTIVLIAFLLRLYLDGVAPLHMRIATERVFARTAASYCVQFYARRMLLRSLPWNRWFEWDSAYLNSVLLESSELCMELPTAALDEDLRIVGNLNAVVETVYDPHREGDGFRLVIERNVLWKDPDYGEPHRESIECVVDWWDRYLSEEGCLLGRLSLYPPVPCDHEFRRYFLRHMKEVLAVEVMMSAGDPLSLYTDDGPIGLLNDIFRETVAWYPSPMQGQDILFPTRSTMRIYRHAVFFRTFGGNEEMIWSRS